MQDDKATERISANNNLLSEPSIEINTNKNAQTCILIETFILLRHLYNVCPPAYVWSYRWKIPARNTLFHTTCTSWHNTARVIGARNEWVRIHPIHVQWGKEVFRRSFYKHERWTRVVSPHHDTREWTCVSWPNTL